MTAFVSIMVIWVVGLISPGPDFAMNLRQSLEKGRINGLWTSIGFGAGIMLHCLYCIFGLGLIISQSIVLFNIIKIAGGLYLIYIGFKSIRAKSTSTSMNKIESKTTEKWQKSFQIGFLCNALNPKATLLVLSLFSQLLDGHQSQLTLVAMGAYFVTTCVVWHGFVAYIFTTSKVIAIYDKSKGFVNKLFGGIIILFGIKTISEVSLK
jgi:RhtB (resistance to homoserine/threonine) family protein